MLSEVNHLSNHARDTFLRPPAFFGPLGAAATRAREMHPGKNARAAAESRWAAMRRGPR